MIEKIVKEKFNYGGYVYSYYRFLDKFHEEPKSWNELLEFTSYLETDNAIHKLLDDLTRREK